MEMFKSWLGCCFVCISLRALPLYAQVEQSVLQEAEKAGTQSGTQAGTLARTQGAPLGYSTSVKPGLPSNAQPTFPGDVSPIQGSGGLVSQSGNDFLMRQIGYRLLGSLFEPFESAQPEPVAPSEATYAESPMLSGLFSLPQYPYTSPYSSPGGERPESSLIETLILGSLLMGHQGQLPQYGNRPTPMPFQGMSFYV